jgi:hypothetical protein
MRMASAKLLKVLISGERQRVEKHHNGEMEPPAPLAARAAGRRLAASERPGKAGPLACFAGTRPLLPNPCPEFCVQSPEEETARRLA